MARNNIEYRGNPNLKQAGVPIDWTPERISEFKKCRDDIHYFVRNYMKIVNVDRGLIHFEMFEFQERMIETFDQNRFILGMLPRQTGKSTTTIAYILHYILFNSEKKVAILANKHSTAKEILRKLTKAYENLPVWLQQGIVKWGSEQIEIENGCACFAATTASDSIRGYSFNLVFLDEFAHVDNTIAQEFFASVYPTISSGSTTKIIAISTPHGLNHFHKMWSDAENGRNNFVTYFAHWSEVPGRDQEWLESQQRDLGDHLFRQEVLCEFIGSANTLIDPGTLERLVYQPPIQEKPNLKIYEHPKQGHVYVATVDVSEGIGGDYSVISVFDVTQIPYKHVAVYRSNEVATTYLPATIHSIATHYNFAHVCIELNIGSEVAHSLHFEYEYENILHTTQKNFQRQQLTDGGSSKAQLGMKMSATTKRVGCTTLKELIENDKLITNDHDTHEEMFKFVARNRTYKAQNDNDHDDIVMTMVNFAWLTSQDLFKEITNTNVQKRLQQDQFDQVPESIVPFGYVSYGGQPGDTLGTSNYVSDENLPGPVYKDDVFGWAVIDSDDGDNW